MSEIETSEGITTFPTWTLYHVNHGRHHEYSIRDETGRDVLGNPTREEAVLFAQSREMFKLLVESNGNFKIINGFLEQIFEKADPESKP